MLVTGAAAAAAEPGPAPLWQGGEGPCRIRLESPSGELALTATAGRPRLLGDASAWSLEANVKDGTTRLMVSPRAAEASALRLEVPPSCQLTVVNQRGTIDAAGPFAAPLELESDSGSVMLRVPVGSDLAVDLATSGEITVDFSVSIDYRHHQEPAKQGRILLGSAVHRVRLSNSTGSIRVLKLNE